MFFSEIKPFIRYIHYLYLNTTSDYHCSVPRDSRFFYVCEGNGKISVGSCCYSLEKGDCLLIHSGIPYHLHTPENSVTYLALNFDYTFSHKNIVTPIPPVPVESFSDSCIIVQDFFEDLIPFNDHCVIRGLLTAEITLIKIREEYLKRLLYHEYKESQLFSQILLEIARSLQTPALLTKKGLVPQILDYVHERYSENLTNRQIGEVFGFHPNYINALIKDCTGMSLHSYLIHVRLSHATDLLENDTLSVGEIALVCGFCDIFHFSRCFKKEMGISPNQYRKLLF